MRQVLGAGALGRPRGMGWGGRWEGGSGWGTHVNPWLIHVNVWQKPLQYCKVISLQLIKINEFWMHETSARTWCSGRTWRERVAREVGGGIGMGKTCKLKDVSFQCMTKFTTNLKKKKMKKKTQTKCWPLEADYYRSYCLAPWIVTRDSNLDFLSLTYARLTSWVAYWRLIEVGFLGSLL